MILFLTGLVLGTFMGVATMCLMVMSKEKSQPHVRWIDGRDQAPGEKEIQGYPTYKAS